MRRVFILVERRADYSRYKPILEKLKADPFFEVYLVVSGLCLLREHGHDVEQIKKDGFKIQAELKMFRKRSPDSGAEMVRAIGRLLPQIVREIEKAKPDLILSGFDIGGNFALTVAGAHMNIPVAHIQGGEVTGSIDESLRHAMSKFAHLHFPATELSRKRLIRMGERPETIFVVGCPSLDAIVKTQVLPKDALEREFGLDFTHPFILLIQHPVTTEDLESFSQIKETIAALKGLGVQTVALLPNNDAGHLKIIRELKRSGIKWYPSLSILKFVNLYRHAWAIVGNSSSGIHESPTLKVPAVNIGTRQTGRERAANVLDVPYRRKAIRAALKKALFDKDFRRRIKKIKNPYGDGHAAEKIVRVLKKISLEGIVQKKFYD